MDWETWNEPVFVGEFSSALAPDSASSTDGMTRSMMAVTYFQDAKAEHDALDFSDEPKRVEFHLKWAARCHDFAVLNPRPAAPTPPESPSATRKINFCGRRQRSSDTAALIGALVPVCQKGLPGESTVKSVPHMSTNLSAKNLAPLSVDANMGS